MREPYRFVIAGEVDHGKSTLIGRIIYDTGSIPQDRIKELQSSDKHLDFSRLLDHLKEERSQSRTIDTTEVFFKTGAKCYLIIDSPGHIEFIKNMITGSTRAQGAVLIVEALSGIGDQTRRHLLLLSLLGIKRILAVINKMDLVGFKEDVFLKLKSEIELLFTKLGLKACGFIPISALNGDNVIKRSKNMPYYRCGSLTENLKRLKHSKAKKAACSFMSVQDVYEVKSENIIVGPVLWGHFKKNSKIKILPSKKTAKIDSICRYPRFVKTAVEGQNPGLVLSGAGDIKRGDIISSLDFRGQAVTEFKAVVFWFSGSPDEEPENLVIKCATQESACSLKIERFLNTLTFDWQSGRDWSGLEITEVTVKTASPIVVLDFCDLAALGRFVLSINGRVLAGGIAKIR